jgi:hypothetical protein
MSRFCKVVSVTTIAVLAFTSTAHADVTVFNQPFSIAGSDTSQNDTRPGGLGNYDTAYDDFSLAGGASIDKVTWVGAYFNGNPGGVTGFTVNFYANNGGVPGSLLETVPIAGNAGETGLGLDTFGNSMFNYSATLPQPFAASAGTPYWMSVVADLPMDVNFHPQWGWEQGTGGNGTAYQTGPAFGFALTNDLAFSLVSSATPEPGSVALMVGMGLSGVVCFRRRKLARKTA